MSEDINIEGLKASLNIAVEEIGKMQSSLEVSRDRADGVLEILRRVAGDCGQDEAVAAIAGINVANDYAKDAITATLVSVRSLVTWLGRM